MMSDVETAIMARQHIVIVPTSEALLSVGSDFVPLPKGQTCEEANCLVDNGQAYTYTSAQSVVSGDYNGHKADHWLVLVGIQDIGGERYFIAYDPDVWETHQQRDFYLNDYSLPKGRRGYTT